MNKIRMAFIVTIAMLLGPLAANAGSITLTPAADYSGVDVGDVVSFDIFMDFTDDATLGGGFDVIFDELALGFIDFVSAGLGDPGFTRDPDVLAGMLAGIAFGDFAGLTGPALVGTLTFEVLAGLAEGMTTMIDLGPTGTVAGPFVSAATFQEQNVEFAGADVTRMDAIIVDPCPDPNNPDCPVDPPVGVPEPGTLGLLGLGLMALGIARRRRLS